MRESTDREDERRDDVATPSDREALSNAAAAIRNRLGARGVRLLGDESSNELVQLLEAVERWELAIERLGGDLMVDEPPEGRRVVVEPDDPRFVLPLRRDDESLGAYIQRIDVAAWSLRGVQGETT